MRLKYLKLKITSLAFVFLLVLQSCCVYKKTPITLDEAVKSNAKVRVELNNQKQLDLKKIEFKDGQYFGLKKINSELVSVPLDEKEIKSIRIFDKPKSDLGNVALIAGIAAVIGGFILAATFTVF